MSFSSFGPNDRHSRYEQYEQRALGKRRVFRLKGKLVAWIVIFLIIYAAALFTYNFKKLYALQQNVKNLQTEINELNKKNQELRLQLELVRSNDYVEQVARQKLGLVKKGEAPIMPLQSSETGGRQAD